MNYMELKRKDESLRIKKVLAKLQRLQSKYCNNVDFWITTSSSNNYIDAISVTLFKGEQQYAFDFYGFWNDAEFDYSLEQCKEILRNK